MSKSDSEKKNGRRELFFMLLTLFVLFTALDSTLYLIVTTYDFHLKGIIVEPRPDVLAMTIIAWIIFTFLYNSLEGLIGYDK